MRVEALLFSGEPPDPQATVETRELHQAVWAAVEGLSPKNRAATELFYYRQLSLQEIATALGISVSAVKGRLHKSRKQLRAMLAPAFPERVPTAHRRKAMARVTVADIVVRKWESGQAYYGVVLLDDTSHRILFIWISAGEGEPMASRLLDRRVPGPQSHDLLANILATLGTRLEEVRIETLQEDIFYATVALRSGDTVHEIDARPSDAINVALRTDSPIYVSEEVMGKVGIEIPEDVWKTREPGKGLEKIVQEWDRRREEWEQKRKATEARPPPTEQEIEKRNRELIELVFGPEPDR